jgi:hypothetical protein
MRFITVSKGRPTTLRIKRGSRKEKNNPRGAVEPNDREKMNKKINDQGLNV